MACCAFLLAPARPLPATADRAWSATVQSWTVASDHVWARLVEALPAAEAAKAPRYLAGPQLSQSLAGATRTAEPRIVASARAWTEAAFRRYRDAGFAGEVPDNGLVTAQAELGIAEGISAADLVEYRGGFKPLSKLRAGGTVGFVHRTKDDNAYAIASRRATERIVFEEIARAAGGDHLALWTFGHAVHVLLARAAPGQRPTLTGPCSFRLRNPCRAPTLAPLLDALASSAFRPDAAALRGALSAPSLDLEAWFEAFGVGGVKSPSSPDAPALWARLDAIRAAVASGSAVDAGAVARLDAVLAPLHVKVPKKQPRKVELDALFAPATFALARSVGVDGRPWPPEPPAGKTDHDRYRAEMRARTFALLADPLQATPVAGWDALAPALGEVLAYDGRLSETEGGFVAFRVAIPDAPGDALVDLRTAFQGSGLVAGYGSVWVEPDAVVGAMCSSFDVATLVTALADLGAGTRLELAVGPDRRSVFTHSATR